MPSFKEVTREDWGAAEAYAKQELYIPVTKIQIMYNTGTSKCDNQKHCMKILRQMQHNDMYYKKMPDINYNFLIGGDGNVYEGRGFARKPTLQTDWILNSMVIGLIGDYSVEEPPQLIYDVVDEFIKVYIKDGKIAPSWKKYYIKEPSRIFEPYPHEISTLSPVEKSEYILGDEDDDGEPTTPYRIDTDTLKLAETWGIEEKQPEEEKEFTEEEEDDDYGVDSEYSTMSDFETDFSGKEE